MADTADRVTSSGTVGVEVSTSGDPYKSSVVLGLHMDGTNGGTTFTDEAGGTLVVNGNANTSTAQSRFGGSSALFDGAGDYLTVADSTTFEMPGDFTVECWFMVSAFPSAGDAGYATLINKRVNSAAYAAFGLFIDSNAKLFYAVSLNGAAYAASGTSTQTLVAGAWYHVALVRSGAAVAVYLNGTSIMTGTASGALFDNIGTVNIGGEAPIGTFARWLNGYLDDVRITKGAARYINNFAVPTAAFPDAIRFTESADTLSSSGTIGSTSVTATLAVTDTQDTVASATSIVLAASLASTDTNELLTSTVTVVSGVAASFAVTESTDTLVASATALVSSSLAVADAGDTVAGVVGIPVAASGAGQDTGDTLVSVASVAALGVTVSLAVTEGLDVLAAVASLPVVASGSTRDSSDTPVSTVSVPVAFTGAATDARDTLSAAFTSANGVLASLAVTDGTDRATAAAGVTVGAAATITESGDRAVGVALMPLTASASVREADDGVAAQVAVFIAAQLAAVESGDALLGIWDNGVVALRDGNRTFIVAPEVRGVVMSADDRTLIVPTESRTHTTPASITVAIAYS